ncbi:MAG: hypothetical protein B6I18_07910 [Bacteroidetes bacterium 4572_112]|nr:MAG: hypothetical protein B6I18_07910 [Bacteroidetes bacterium 4572_112]
MKFLSILIILLFTLNISYSQYTNNSYNYYSVGIKMGPDYYKYTMNEDKDISIDMKTNYSAGISGAYYISWLFELHASVYYSNRDFAIDWHYPNIGVGPNDPEVLIRTEYTMQYISIPMEARINALYLNWMKLSFGTGLLTDWRFKPQETQYYNNGKIIVSEQYWQTKDFTRVLLAVPLSANMKVYLGQHLSIEASAAYYFYLNRMQTDYFSKPANAFVPRLAFFYEWG